MSYNIESLSQLKGAPFVLGIDVGGTNTRVSLGTSDGTEYLFTTFEASTLPVLLSGLEAAGAELTKHITYPPSAACIDIAGPVFEEGEKAEITNYAGSREERIISKAMLPRSLFTPETTAIVNDLEACCYGILALAKAGRLPELFSPLWSDGKDDMKLRPVHYAVLSAGTGLGVGLLVKLPGMDFQVLPLEGGHGLISPGGKGSPDYDQEHKLLEFLGQKLYNGKHGPEWEDIVSGRGIQYCYEFLTRADDEEKKKNLSTADIVAAAFATPHSANAQDALLLHYKYLIRCSQGISVALQAKGIFLAGDNQVNNDKFVRTNSHVLHKEFLSHPKQGWVENVPVYAQHTKFNINLFGTLYVANYIASRGGAKK
eukprot:TRINITY_DN1632_c0_g1_i5.p1 TRINITY_DN1632_c0_g1~~TRINITY_DN1632_c0_g1_i5.p1  ORF type:complete len:430 (+),score=95.96 TRINITY_DN1632_c0_g1_i5:178-1290(+)